jgi:quinol monooxygenase YgiN
MPGVIVIARVRPNAGTRAEFEVLLREVQELSRADDGCENYGYYAEIADPDNLVAVEEWRDEAALKAHLATPHVQRLIAELGPYLAEPPTIEAHQVAATGPLPL